MFAFQRVVPRSDGSRSSSIREAKVNDTRIGELNTEWPGLFSVTGILTPWARGMTANMESPYTRLSWTTDSKEQTQARVARANAKECSECQDYADFDWPRIDR